MSSRVDGPVARPAKRPPCGRSREVAVSSALAGTVAGDAEAGGIDATAGATASGRRRSAAAQSATIANA